ncbi:MAG: hypothetical protein ACP5LH_00815 [Candidatus Micrarchaeia archaeon]
MFNMKNQQKTKIDAEYVAEMLAKGLELEIIKTNKGYLLTPEPALGEISGYALTVTNEKDFISIGKGNREVLNVKNFIKLIEDLIKTEEFEIDAKEDFIHLYHKKYNPTSYKLYKNLKYLYDDAFEISEKLAKEIKGSRIESYSDKRKIEIIKEYILDNIEYKNILKINYNVYNNETGFITFELIGGFTKNEINKLYEAIKKTLGEMRNFNINFIDQQQTKYFVNISKKKIEESQTSNKKISGIFSIGRIDDVANQKPIINIENKGQNKIPDKIMKIVEDIRDGLKIANLYLFYEISETNNEIVHTINIYKIEDKESTKKNISIIKWNQSDQSSLYIDISPSISRDYRNIIEDIFKKNQNYTVTNIDGTLLIEYNNQ